MTKSWIVIGSANGSGNAGDEAMWVSAVQGLRDAIGRDVPIITDGRPGWTGGLNGVTTERYLFHTLMRTPRFYASQWPLTAKLGRILSRPRQLPRALRAYRRSLLSPRGALQESWFRKIAAAEGLVFSGAGALTDRYAVHGTLSWALMSHWARLNSVPVAYIGQGIGPYENPELEKIAVSGLRNARAVGVRDPRSFAWAQGQDLPGRVSLNEDWAVLATPTERDRRRALEVRRSLIGDAGYISVCFHRVHGLSTQQLTALRSLANSVVEVARTAQLKVIFVPNMIGGGPNDDRETAKLLLSEAIARGDASLVESAETAGVLRGILGGSRALVATRYHSAVFAGAESVPTIGIAIDPYWRQKLEGAISFAGVPGLIVDVGDPSAVTNAAGAVQSALSNTLQPLKKDSMALEPAIDLLRSFVAESRRAADSP